ncbi:hypothetical protein AADW59_00920 [Candidatus Hodgkinia cicadicola]
MKILVATKVVADPNVEPSVKANQIQTANIKRVIDYVNEASLQAAINIKSTRRGAKVTAVCIGTDADRNALKCAFAMGADDTVLIKHADANALDVAALIRRLVVLENYELVLLSNRSSDNESGQTPPALAELLGWTHLSNVVKLKRMQASLHALCLLEEGRAWFKVSLPCVLACNARVAKPRYFGLAELVDADNKKLRTKTVHAFNKRITQLTTLGYKLAPNVRSGILIDGLSNTLEIVVTCLEAC